MSLWIAVPAEAADDVARGLLPLLPGIESVFVSGVAMEQLLPAVRGAVGTTPLYGVHALVDASMASLEGQILYVVPDAGDGAACAEPPAWLAEATAEAGGILKVGTAAEHDAAMREVRERAHRVLVDFADAVTASGLDLEHDLWEARTPLFETLFGLAVRALDSRESPLPASDTARVRDRFPGSLYDTIRGSAAAAVTAAQSKRLALAAAWRSGAIVGLRTVHDPAPRVGRIAELTSTSATLDELMTGRPGSAALLDGPGIANAARLGVAPRRSETTFGLGHVELVTGDELEAVLDEQLAHLQRDVRFLVPESVAGAGVLRVVEGERGLRDCTLVDEVVRTGQRSVVIRMGIRADLDPAAVAEALQERVAAAYRWPTGLALELVAPVARVAYLGPAGTFSEDAARQCAANVGAADAELVALPSFGDVLAAVGDGVLGVLPITSSASGLVTRAVQAILAHGAPLTAGGMVDVAVRFDAYARGDLAAEALRGATVFSHPQGLAQCGAFIRRWSLQAVPCDSTAAALERAASAETPAIALAGVGKGEALGLRVLEREVDDLSGSITRFVILGDRDAWGAFAGGSRPTLRRLWVGDDPADAIALLGGGAGFDELLTDADGRWLLVSSRSDAPAVPPGAHALGAVPWSPRTPVVRAGA